MKPYDSVCRGFRISEKEESMWDVLVWSISLRVGLDLYNEGWVEWSYMQTKVGKLKNETVPVFFIGLMAVFSYFLSYFLLLW